MTRAEFEAMSFEEVMEWAYDNIDDITTEDTLIEFAKRKIDDDNLNVALHVLNAIYESPYSEYDYYHYDYCMGTLEKPVAITCKEDLEDFIYFDEEEDE